MPYKDKRSKRARLHKKAARANRRYPGRRLTVDDLADLFARSDCCCYCGKPVDWRSGTLEHVDPIRGNDLGNLEVACAYCNNAKRDRPAEYLARRLAMRGIEGAALPADTPVQRLLWLDDDLTGDVVIDLPGMPPPPLTDD